MSSNRYKIEVSGLAKRFNRNTIFKDINFAIETGTSFSITGPNGSGKSTLLRALACLTRPSQGTVTYTDLGRGSIIADWMPYIGYAGPLVNPYDDLTALENIQFALKDASKESNIVFLLDHFNISKFRDQKIKYYSSGMKQRIKIILAELNDPPVLLLDEPGSNLDESGRNVLYSYLDSVRDRKIIILATNEKGEEQLCGGGVRLG